jgi:tetratricopeptide (TPR) repeat protein
MMAAWFVLIGLFVSVPVWSAEYPAPLNNLNVSDTDTTEAGMALFDRARTNLWAATGSPESNVGFLDRAATTFESVSDPAAQAYLLARVELYRGRIALDTESKSSARTYFERSMELADRSIDITESAEALRVLADAGSSWMITKGLGGIIKMAPQVQEWSARAVEMDPENALAIIISTQGQINAPKSAGGDPDEAARRLVLLNSRTDLGDIERFWARVSLSQAYKKLKRRDDAAVWCRKAAEIFPQSPMLEECS